MKRVLAGLLITGALLTAKVKEVEKPAEPLVMPETVFQQVNSEEGWSLTIYRYRGANIIVKEMVTDDGSQFVTMVAPNAAFESMQGAVDKGMAIIDRGGM